MRVLRSPESKGLTVILAALGVYLGARACGGEIETTEPSRAKAIEFIFKTGGAVILPGLDECPPVEPDQTTIIQSAPGIMPDNMVAQTYVGNPNTTLPNGNRANLYAARVTTMYTVGKVEGSVYCGPDYGDHGQAFTGVMMVGSENPDLIVDVN